MDVGLDSGKLPDVKTTHQLIWQQHFVLDVMKMKMVTKHGMILCTTLVLDKMETQIIQWESGSMHVQLSASHQKAGSKDQLAKREHIDMPLCAFTQTSISQSTKFSS